MINNKIIPIFNKNILSKNKIILIRHGESIWNIEKKFTGWTDIPLTHKGYIEAYKISEKLKELNLEPNIIFSSVLTRSIKTAEIIKNKINKDIQIHTSWRLNEKHYGQLEGVPRKFITELFGANYLKIMRNNFRMKPPLINYDDKNNDVKNIQYKIYRNCYYNTIKNGESKEDVLLRLLPYYQNDILYHLEEENKIPLIVSHKHTIRVLMKHLLNMSDNDFENYLLKDKSIIIVNLDEKLRYLNHLNINYYE